MLFFCKIDTVFIWSFFVTLIFLFALVLNIYHIADAGTLVDSYVAGKIKQLKEQIATLEKREER